MRKAYRAAGSIATRAAVVRTAPAPRGRALGLRARSLPAVLPGTALRARIFRPALLPAGATWAERIAAARAGGALGDYPETMEGILDEIKGALSTAVSAVKSAVTAGITALPGAQDAVNYVKAQVGRFFQLPQRIKAAQQRAQTLQAAAAGKGMNTEAAEAGAVSGTLTSASSTYASTEKKLTGLLDALKAAGFGAIPVALLAVAVAVAASMAYLFKTISFNESILDKIEKKVLTPKEAQELFGKSPLLGIDVPWWLWGAGIAVGGYVLYEKFGKRRAGAAS